MALATDISGGILSEIPGTISGIIPRRIIEGIAIEIF